MSCRFLLVALSLLIVSSVFADDKNTQTAAQQVPPRPHPLDPAIQMAREGLERIQKNVNDYSCTFVKQERVNGELLPPEYMYTEIRNHKEKDGVLVTPFSVYMYWLKPEGFKGRETTYVEGTNDGKLTVLDSKFRMLGPLSLDPTGKLAMQGNRHPITDSGIENLLVQLIIKGDRDRQYGECTAEFKEGVKINNRVCTMLEVIHPHPRPYFEFHIARIFIDKDMDLPTRYEAYTWPTTAGGKPELLECYTFLNVKVNAGLQAQNFSPDRFRR